jgi:xanthine dehydrogenase accessory factor
MMLGGLVVVKGGGDLGTGVAHRLRRAGYRVVVLEVERPMAVRRTVAFASAVTDGSIRVEGVEARRVTLEELRSATNAEGGAWPTWVPVIVDPEGVSVSSLGADAVVDARMAKVNLGTTRADATATVGLGPGFHAGRDVDLVVETARGHSLGRVIDDGPALPDTGVPGPIAGQSAERLIRSPADGVFESTRRIGDLVGKGDVVGRVGGEPVRAATSGLLRGLVADGVRLSKGQKMGDVDPRGAEIDHRLISDKARSIGGAVLEALLRCGVLPGRTSEVS